MQTKNKGADYGLGITNVDLSTGIRFGVIPGRETFNCADEVYANGKDLDFESYLDEAKNKLRDALSDFLSDHKWHQDRESKLGEAVRNCFEVIEQDLADSYPGSDGCTRMLYERDGYKILAASDGDLFVEKSPYFTRAQFCSPCAPGACYLMNPCDDAEKAYCLNHDWFEDGKAPYPVYAVETGKEIVPVEKRNPCPNCGGTGRDSLERLARVRECKVSEINLGELHVSGFDKETGTFDCFRCDGAGTIKETVYAEKS